MSVNTFTNWAHLFTYVLDIFVHLSKLLHHNSLQQNNLFLNFEIRTLLIHIAKFSEFKNQNTGYSQCLRLYKLLLISIRFLIKCFLRSFELISILSFVIFHKVPKNSSSSNIRFQFILKRVIVTIISITLNNFYSFPITLRYIRINI